MTEIDVQARRYVLARAAVRALLAAGAVGVMLNLQSSGVLYDAIAGGGFTGAVYAVLGGAIIICLMLLAIILPIGCALDLWMAWAMYREGKNPDA